MDTLKKEKKELLINLYKAFDLIAQQSLPAQMSTRMVCGVGNPNAELLLIGEAPGANEDKLGEPFVGRSGKLLNKLLESVGLQREDVYISNIVKYRPPNNRKPYPNEIAAGKKLLEKEIEIIQPRVICTLGSSSAQGLLDIPDLKISQIRGTNQKFHNTLVVPTYHPAFILRNPKELETLYSDLKRVADIIQSATS